MRNFFNPKVSIVIPVYNGSNYLKEAIDSALAQTYKNIEIIVVNDGSTDGGKTDKICRSYGDKIRYFPKENGGVASALNKGIGKMKGEYFSWLSHDDVYYHNKVEKQVLALSTISKKQTTLIYSNVEYINEKSETIRQTKYEKEYSHKALNSKLFPVLKGLTNGCNILIPKRCFNETGLFNENLKTANDYEMWFRLFRKYDTKFITDVLTKYRFHALQGTKTIKTYANESDDLWASVIKSLKKEEILPFEKSLFNFYFNLSKQMKAGSLRKATKAASAIAKKLYSENDPGISVIMPCYNSRKYIKEAIDSILDQSYSNLELIIVDDFSKDTSYSFVKKMKEKDYRIVLMKNKFKKGIVGAMNTGIDIAKGEYVTRMDSDDISLQDRLNKQFLFLERNKEYDFCSVNISTFGSSERSSVYKETDTPLEALFIWSNPIASAPTMFRKAFLQKYKLRFENYSVAEDYDLLTRAVLFGKPAMIYEVLYKYRIRMDSMFRKNQKKVLRNSAKINDIFVKNIVGEKIPKWHTCLTDFVLDKGISRNISLLEMAEWVEKVLQKAKKKFKWNEIDYQLALKDAENRIINNFTNNEFESIWRQIEIDNEKLSLILGESNKRIDVLEKENYNLTNSLSWKMTKPFRLLSKLVTLIKRQGIITTLRNLYLKFIKSNL